MAELAFVGLGVMGGCLAKRLLRAGHTLTGYNRTADKAKWLPDAGFRLVASPGAEGVVMAEKSAIPRDTAIEVMLASVAASPMLKYRVPFVLGMPEEAWFDGA